MTVNTDLRSAAVRNQIFVERYKGSVVRKLIRLLVQADRDIIRLLRARDVGTVSLRTERLKQLRDALRTIIDDTNKVVDQQLRGQLRELTKQELGIVNMALTSSINAQALAIPTVVPAAGVVYGAAISKPFDGRLLSEWSADLRRSKRIAVERAIRIGIVEGESTAQIVRRLRGSRAANYRDGILTTQRRHTEAIARTAISHVVSETRNESYKANEDIIKAVQWVSTLDSRTCLVAGSQLQTPDGLMSIEDIKEGDTVIGGSLKPRKVLATMQATTKSLVKVTLDSGKQITCTPDHLFLCNGRWVEAQNLTEDMDIDTKLQSL